MNFITFSRSNVMVIHSKWPTFIGADSDTYKICHVILNVSLGRPWRPYAQVLYIHCYIGSHIKPEGWSNWNNTENYKTVKYAEYKNYGPSSEPGKRVEWSKQLSDG